MLLHFFYVCSDSLNKLEDRERLTEEGTIEARDAMVLKEIMKRYSGMSDAESRIADFVLANPQDVIHMSMAELASATDTSDASVMRMCKRIGQSGYYQMKINLAIETSGEGDSSASHESIPADVVDFVEKTCSAVSGIAKNIGMAEVKESVEAITSAETVYTFGWGNSSTVAQDFAHRLMSGGVTTFNSDNVEYIMRSLVLAKQSDVLFAFSHSGQTILTIECLKLARDNGIRTVLVTNEPNGPMTSYADIVLCCGAEDSLLGDWGQVSHVPEFVVSDLLLYFLKDRLERVSLGRKSEAILGQFKL